LLSGTLSADLVARLRSDHSAKRPGAWTVAVDGATAEDLPEELYDEQTLLGEYLRTVRLYAKQDDEQLDLEAFLAERHATGNLGSAATLDDPAVRRRVLAEAAALGAELLSPREAGS